MIICLFTFITQENDSVRKVIMIHRSQINEEEELEPVLKPTSLDDRFFSKSPGAAEEAVPSCL